MQAIGGYARSGLGASALAGWHVRHLDPVERVMRAARLPYLAKRCTYMFWPNCPGRSPYNRHYCYKRGVGWVSDIVTLSRPSTKYDVIGGSLKTLAAGEFGANGRIEPQATKLNTITSSLGYATGHEVLTAGVDVLGGSDAKTITEDAVNTSHGGAFDWTVVGGAVHTVSVYVKRGVGTRSLLFDVYGTGGVERYAYVNLGTGAVGGHDGTIAVTAYGDWWKISITGTFGASDGAGAAYLYMTDGGTLSYQGDGLSSIVVANAFFAASAYPTTFIAGAAGTTRAADAYSVADDFSGVRSVVVVGRTPWESGLGATVHPINVWLAGADSGANRLSVWSHVAGTADIQSQFISDGVEVWINEDSGFNLTKDIIHAVGIRIEKSNSAQFYDGSKFAGLSAYTWASDPSFTQMKLATSSPQSFEAMGILLFDRALTDAEMQALTSSAFRTAIAAGL